MIFSVFRNIKKWYGKLLDRKRWIDVVTATLTIPVLLTVIISNILTIRNKQNKESHPPNPVPSQQPITINVEQPSAAPLAIPTVEPKEGLGPTCTAKLPQYDIISPQDGETVSSDPVCVVFAPQESGYCSATWSYRVNGSAWSLFSDQPACLFNMADGDVTFDIRFRSKEGQEKKYTRYFIYQRLIESPSTSPTPSPTP